MPPFWVSAAGPLFARPPIQLGGCGVTPPNPDYPPACPHCAAAIPVVLPEPCRTCSCLCRGLKADGSLVKAPLNSCEPVKPPKIPVSGSCQEKACLDLKSAQKSHSLLNNCGCQSTAVGLHLLHINDSTSDVFALQYQNIGNIKVLAFPNVNCQLCKSWGLGAQQSHRVTHSQYSLGR